MNRFNCSRTALAIAAATLVTPVLVQAQESPWLVRVRAVNIDPANKDDTGLSLSVNSKVIPEVDVSYFFTPNLAAELILTYPQKHTVYSAGTKIGTLKHLPPTLTLQYHVTGLDAFKPYVGAGLNYTRFSNVEFDPAVVAALAPSIDKNSFGLAVQAGFDYALSKTLFLNVDVKFAQIRTDVSSFGTKAGTFKVDPVLFGVGLGWRF